MQTLLLMDYSDDPRNGPAQEFDFDTDEEDELFPKQDVELNEETAASDSDDSSDDEAGHTTMANMEARSRALDAKATAEAELDVKENQEGAAFDEDEDDIDLDAVDGDGDISSEPFHLPTASERDAEKQSGGPDLHVVQQRMKACVRVLGKFKRLAEKGR
jgi:25S rRNA (cytosine2870-C5)-methyltransferase